MIQCFILYFPVRLYLAIKKEEGTSSHGVVQEVINLHRLLVNLWRHLLHRHTLMSTHTHTRTQRENNQAHAQHIGGNRNRWATQVCVTLLRLILNSVKTSR